MHRSFLFAYTQEEAILIIKLKDSSDASMQNSKAPVQTGHKWRVEHAVDQAISRLKHREIVCRTLSPTSAPKTWCKATKKNKKEVVIFEVVRTEEDQYKIKTIGQSKQGGWTTWKGLISRTTGWADMWMIPQARVSSWGPPFKSQQPLLLVWLSNSTMAHIQVEPERVLQQVTRLHKWDHHNQPATRYDFMVSYGLGSDYGRAYCSRVSRDGGSIVALQPSPEKKCGQCSGRPRDSTGRCGFVWLSMLNSGEYGFKCDMFSLISLEWIIAQLELTVFKAVWVS